MRVYFTTTVARAEAIFRDGFTDLLEGVWFADRQLDINDGFEGDVTLCVDVADDLFRQYEWTDHRLGYRHALIPAEVLNRLDKPQIYDHFYAGISRRDLVHSIRTWEGYGQRETWSDEGAKAAEGSLRHGRGMRDALEFFDRIGWLKPLKLHEAEP
jgi:hypothetical protein